MQITARQPQHREPEMGEWQHKKWRKNEGQIEDKGKGEKEGVTMHTHCLSNWKCTSADAESKHRNKKVDRHKARSRIHHRS